MVWYIISAIAFAVTIALLIVSRIRDRRYLKMKTSESMNKDVWAELEEEHSEIFKRREKFQKALKEAEGNPVEMP